jgi:hypothetical protein
MKESVPITALFLYVGRSPMAGIIILARRAAERFTLTRAEETY